MSERQVIRAGARGHPPCGCGATATHRPQKPGGETPAEGSNPSIRIGVSVAKREPTQRQCTESPREGDTQPLPRADRHPQAAVEQCQHPVRGGLDRHAREWRELRDASRDVLGKRAEEQERHEEQADASGNCGAGVAQDRAEAECDQAVRRQQEGGSDDGTSRARIRERHLRICRRCVTVVAEQRLRAHERREQRPRVRSGRGRRSGRSPSPGAREIVPGSRSASSGSCRSRTRR